MKRTILSLIVTAILAITIAPTLAGAPDFSSDAKITKFWQELAKDGGGP